MTQRRIFRVDPAIFKVFPDYYVGCVVARDIGAGHDERVAELLRAATVRARATYGGVDLKSVQQFAAWRDAFSTAGWSASRFPASVEALHKRIQRGHDLSPISPLVDLTNATVLFYSVPVGTHDISSFGQAHLEVRHARTGDQFVGMDGDPAQVDDGEIVYAVGNDVRTRRWTWRQGRSALISRDATDVFFPIDGFRDRTRDFVDGAQNYLAEALESMFAAQVKTGLVDADQPDFFVTWDES